MVCLVVSNMLSILNVNIFNVNVKMATITDNVPSIITASVGPYRLHIVLKQGRDLAAKDACGITSPARNYEYRTIIKLIISNVVQEQVIRTWNLN